MQMGVDSLQAKDKIFSEGTGQGKFIAALKFGLGTSRRSLCPEPRQSSSSPDIKLYCKTFGMLTRLVRFHKAV